MALYKRWVDLKNKVCGREFQLEEYDQPIGGMGKENTDPNLDDEKKIAIMQNQLRDKSMTIELNSNAMIKYIIEDAVKKAFKLEMGKKLKFAMDKV